MANRKKNKRICFWVDEKENELIQQKIKFTKLPKEKFLRDIVINGQIIKKDIEEEKNKLKTINNLANEINKIGININQIAKYTNQIGSISKNEYESLEKKVEEIWQLLVSKLQGI
jgi:DNA-binding transcriptional regulator GbsR (MarR family)